jgi:hypothetical protein
MSGDYLRTVSGGTSRCSVLLVVLVVLVAGQSRVVPVGDSGCRLGDRRHGVPKDC